MERKSMSPGTAARRAPTNPPAMVYMATSLQASPPHCMKNTTSQTKENIHSPMGKTISMG